MIAFHGSIGSGKSTLIKRLSMMNETYVAYLEPVEIWQDSGLLNLLYTDPEGYAFSFQVLALLTRLKQYSEFIENKTNRIMLWERGTESDKIFQNVLKEHKFISSLEIDILNASYKPKALLNIYIRTPPAVCLQRILQRGREEEKDITYKYLQELHDEHERILTDCYVIDGENINIVDVIQKIGEAVLDSTI
jgi:deoxyadenosine/deoxycytidine kinase